MMSDRSDTATGMLRDEHQLILGVVDVLDETLRKPDSASDLDFDVVERCISFFRLFADACHHGKEEDLLFPELIEHGMPGDAGPIAVMLSEHQQGRLSVRGMAQAIGGARSGDEDAVSALQNHADDYIDLIRAHIGKEDNILFNMADEMVLGDACRVLCDRYDVVCERRFEGKTKDDLEIMAAALVAGQPGKA
jgi:hemerythrin-like domain-containing protein